MKAYQDITLLPGADIGQYFLWGKIYPRIHMGLVDNQLMNGLSSIGLAFPEYHAELNQLGTKLRLFAPEKEVLERFNAKRWLNFLSDYIHVTGIRDVPSAIAQYSRFKRKQSKSSMERLARRKAKYELIEFDQALQSLKNKKEVFVNAPFIQMSSRSSGKSFRLFIIKESGLDRINVGFSCYGLSAISTIPDF